MKVGDYVRTEDGYIGKIKSIEKNERMHLYQATIYTDNWRNLSSLLEESVFKSSPNIIDLIEVGDYVNGHRVNYINKDSEHFNISFGNEDFNLKSKFNSDIYWLSKEDIKSIVTKEQFEEMKYEIK